MQRDYWYTAARDADELEAVDAVGRRAAKRAVERLGARRLSTRRAPVLYAPEVARGLIGHFLGAIRGESQYREASFLLHAAGEQIFPEFVRISERPHIPKALGSAAFDSEGVATVDRELVADGVLQGYLLNSYAARKLGLETTGHAGGVHNLIVSGRAGFCRLAEVHEFGFGRRRADGARCEWCDRRLLARRQRLLGRGGRNRIPG
jgi:PmbA protein